jgi:arylsulfatase
MFGNRALYHDGWIASTNPPDPVWLMGLDKMPDVLTGYKWSLYDLTKDFSQNDDLAAQEPAKLQELQDMFLVEAAKYQVFPLDNSVVQRIAAPRPSATAGRDEFEFTGVLSGLPAGSAPSILTRSYTITAEIEVPDGGGEGMLATLGGRFGGFGLYLLDGKPVYTYNLLGLERFRWAGDAALTAGKHTVVFDFTYDGPGFGKGGSGTLSVDGTEVAKQDMPHSIPFLMTIDESFDVGIDTRSPVDDADYQVPFRFTGTIDKLTVKVGDPQL